MSLYQFFNQQLQNYPEIILYFSDSGKKSTTDLYNYYLFRNKKRDSDNFLDMLLYNHTFDHSKNAVQYEILKLKSKLISKQLSDKFNKS